MIMEFFPVQWVDVTPFLLSQQQPVVLIRREPVHSGPKAWAGGSQVGSTNKFWVPTSGLFGTEPAQFAVTQAGEAARVPMFAYKTGHFALPDLFGLGVQIGMAALADLRHHTRDNPVAVHLVIGHQCTDLRPAEEAFRCYIGIAFRM